MRRASVGMVAPEFFTLPNYPGATPNPVEAFSSVPSEGIAQIFLFMAWLELYYFNKGNWTMMTMFEDKDRRTLPFRNRGLVTPSAWLAPAQSHGVGAFPYG